MEETHQEKVEKALSYEELERLKPDTEALFNNTLRATMWYDEAVWTAAALFVEAAEESEVFRRSFISEADAWRLTMQKECPEKHRKLMDIGLSAFQGGSAEQVARKVIRGNCNE